MRSENFTSSICPRNKYLLSQSPFYFPLLLKEVFGKAFHEYVLEDIYNVPSAIHHKNYKVKILKSPVVFKL